MTHTRRANQSSRQIEKQITRALPAFRFSFFTCRLFGTPASQLLAERGGERVGGWVCWVLAIEIIVVVSFSVTVSASAGVGIGIGIGVGVNVLRQRQR